jgi:glycine betaine/proline transport system substrate-binding protein
MLWLWTPNWTESKYDGEFVKFPAYEDACYQDPKWGVNPNKAYDCGKPEGWIKKMAWKDGKTKWACAYDVVAKYDMDAKSLALMAAKVDLDGKEPREVAREWIDNNKPIWEKWTACAK